MNAKCCRISFFFFYLFIVKSKTYLVYNGISFELCSIFEYDVNNLNKFFSSQSRSRGSIEKIDKVVQQKISTCEKTVKNEFKKKNMCKC